MMKLEQIQEAIRRGRDFLKSQDTAELERNGSDYKTDQELKKPQPPLGKGPHDGEPHRPAPEF